MVTAASRAVGVDATASTATFGRERLLAGVTGLGYAGVGPEPYPSRSC
jgi:hypothetical protein